jgi:hypothetical protein
MPSFLAHSVQTGINMLIAAVALTAISHVWTWVIAAQRSVWWFLFAFLFLPVAWVVLVFVESRTLRPLGVWLAGAGLSVWSISGIHEPFTTEEFVDRFLSTLSLKEEKPKPEPLEVRKTRVREWQARLEAKKAALKPGDPAGKAAFDREVAEYLAELEKVKAEVQKAAK